MKKSVIILTLSCVIAVSWLLARSLHMQEELKPKAATGITKNITVFIHGTRGTAFLPIGISDRLSQVEKKLCSAPLGLHRITSIDPTFNNVTIGHALDNADHEQFSFKHFYSFGWSGDLNPEARNQAALELHTQLKQLVLNYVVRYATIPNITIITHSHGGNVALNLASISEENNPLIIEKLILLACPVQQETAQYADAPLFKKIYALYSQNDQLQILDPQGLHPLSQGIKESWDNQSLKPLANGAKESSNRPLFSERHFASTKVKHIDVSWATKAPWLEADLNAFAPLSDRVKKWTEWDTKPRGLLHVEFLLYSFICRLPELLAFADEYPYDPKNSNAPEFTL